MFAEKLLIEGIEKSDVKSIEAKEVNFAALSKLAIDFSDGVIQASENINQEVVEYVKENNKKFLSYCNPEDYADDYVRFYDSLI